MYMDKTCGIVTGLMVLIAGACLLAFGLGMLSATLANEVAGVLIVLTGISVVVHALCMCPMCKCPEEKKGK